MRNRRTLCEYGTIQIAFIMKMFKDERLAHTGFLRDLTRARAGKTLRREQGCRSVKNARLPFLARKSGGSFGKADGFILYQ